MQEYKNSYCHPCQPNEKNDNRVCGMVGSSAIHNVGFTLSITHPLNERWRHSFRSNRHHHFYFGAYVLCVDLSPTDFSTRQYSRNDGNSQFFSFVTLRTFHTYFLLDEGIKKS